MCDDFAREVLVYITGVPVAIVSRLVICFPRLPRCNFCRRGLADMSTGSRAIGIRKMDVLCPQSLPREEGENGRRKKKKKSSVR